MAEFTTPLHLASPTERSARVKGAKSAKGKAVDAALTDAAKHVVETPVNQTPYGKWYGMNGVAWCCIYVTYQLVNSGFTGFERGKFASFCGNVVDAAKNRQRGLAITKE